MGRFAEIAAEEPEREDLVEHDLYWQELLAQDPDYVYYLDGLNNLEDET